MWVRIWRWGRGSVSPWFWLSCSLSLSSALSPSLLTHTRTQILTHPPQKYHHSTQDQILHPAQPTRQPAQFHERISARITVKSFLKIVAFRLKTLLFLRWPPLKNIITRCRIKFCIQHNQLDSQHSFTGEYQQEILESAANFSYVNSTSKYQPEKNFRNFFIHSS